MWIDESDAGEGHESISYFTGLVVFNWVVWGETDPRTEDMSKGFCYIPNYLLVCDKCNMDIVLTRNELNELLTIEQKLNKRGET
jgi:hypothetical protein